MNNNAFALQNDMPEGTNPSGIPIGRSMFTDVNGRSILQQYPAEMAAQQPVNNITRIDNYFDQVRAQNMMYPQPNMQLQSQQFYTNGGITSQPYGFGSTFGNQMGQFAPCPVVMAAPDISYDSVYNQNNNNPFQFKRNAGYYSQMPMQAFTTPIINDKPAFIPTMGAFSHNLSGYDPAEDNLLPEAVDEDLSSIMVPVQEKPKNVFTQSYGSLYSTNPNSIFNGYYNPYFNPATLQFKSPTEMREEANNKFNVFKKLCNCAAAGAGLAEVTDKDIISKFNPQNNLPKYEPDYTPKIPVVLMKGDEVVFDPYAEKRPPVPLDEKVVYQRAVNCTYNSLPYNLLCAIALQNHNKMYDEAKAKFPDNMGIIEFLNNAGSLYSDMLIRDSVRRTSKTAVDMLKKQQFEKDIASAKRSSMMDAYQHNDADRIALLNAMGGLRNMSGQYNGQFRNDQEYTDYTGISLNPNGGLNITVPERLREKHIQENTNYDQRRENFVSTILGNKALATPERRGCDLS